MAVQHQVHDKFKVYLGKTISDINSTIQADTADGCIAAKSIGVEYMEARNQFLVSVGYAEGQAGYKVGITDNVVGPLPEFNDAPDQLCSSMEAIVAEFSDVICHELFVDNDEVVHLVLMLKL
jgi:hypothetical protein